MGRRMARIQLERPLELEFSAGPVPIETELEKRDQRMTLDESVVERESAGGRRSGTCDLLWRGQQAEAQRRTEGVALSEGSVSGCIAGVSCNRFLEMLDRLGKRSRGPFVHEIATLQICLIGLPLPR